MSPKHEKVVHQDQFGYQVAVFQGKADEQEKKEEGSLEPSQAKPNETQAIEEQQEVEYVEVKDDEAQTYIERKDAQIQVKFETNVIYCICKECSKQVGLEDIADEDDKPKQSPKNPANSNIGSTEFSERTPVGSIL